MTTGEPKPPMHDETRCSQCGARLAPGALAGLCPACLLQQGAAADSVTGAESHTFEPPSVDELAPLFPQLEIFELIGKGGMGAVYKARQKELDRVVALKILPPAMGDTPDFAERFSREAKALAKLNHPGIVTIHEFGRADGLFYFLMEFVDGVNLRQLLTGGRVSPREALVIVPEICDALQFAHDHGIVHRDIKPANILLDRRGRVKVADFGLAKLVEAGAEATATNPGMTADQSLSQPGKVMGTPSYMAPEQTERPEEVDHRADIYSLGVVLYELLTGELPAAQLQPPSQKVRLDVRLDEIVLRALQERPERRYHTAVDFKTQLTEVANSSSEVVVRSESAGATSHARGQSNELPAARSRRARRIAVGGALMLLGGFAVAFLLPRPFYSKVTMEVRPDDYSGFSGRGGFITNPAFIATQMQAIRTLEVLQPVVEMLGLEKAFSTGDRPLSRSEAFLRLLRTLDIREVRNTGLIEVGVYNRDPQMAANIANTIAVVYKEKRLRNLQGAIDRGLSQIKGEVERQRKYVEMAFVEMDRLRQGSQIVDPDPESFNAAVNTADGSGDREVLAAYVDAKSRYLQGKRLLEAAELKYATERFNRNIDFDPVKTWENAVPALKRAPFRLRRFW